jgi:type IX secretion system PorP/SprF family membrane protein
MKLTSISFRLIHSYWFCFLLLTVAPSFGQQSAQFSLFPLHQLYYNPAAAGFGNQTQVQVTHRAQYAGYQGTVDAEGAPTSQLLSASIPVKNLGFGLTALNDRTGASSMQDVQLSAAYRFTLANEHILAFGVRAGILRKALDYGKLRPNDLDDPLLQTGTAAEMHPNVSLGLHYSSDAYYLSISAVNLLKPAYQFGSAQAVNTVKSTYNAQLGVNLDLGYLLQIRPIVNVQTNLTEFSYEGGAIATYDSRYWLGATYRKQDAVIAMAGIDITNDQSLRLSGAVDLVHFGKTAKRPTSYEVMLAYVLPAPKFGKKTIIRTPRFRFEK